MCRLNHFKTLSRGFVILLMVVASKGCSRRTIDYLGQKPPGMTASIFAPGLISTTLSEHSAPAFSPDGTVVLWTMVNKSYRASMMEMKYQNGKWSAPHRSSFADTTADDYYPSFSVDGKKLYFGSRRKVPAGFPERRGMRVWEVDRVQCDWSMPVPFDTIASQGRNFAHSISKNGTLYFSSPNGDMKNFDVYKSEKIDGRYLKPVLLPDHINSPGYEDGPYIAPDESFLIFESDRPGGINGSLDLYISFKDKDTWSPPVNMGPKINSDSAERFARLSPDGKYLFFGSGRNAMPGGWGFDIYWIDAKIIEELKDNVAIKAAIKKQ